MITTAITKRAMGMAISHHSTSACSPNQFTRHDERKNVLNIVIIDNVAQLLIIILRFLTSFVDCDTHCEEDAHGEGKHIKKIHKRGEQQKTDNTAEKFYTGTDAGKDSNAKKGSEIEIVKLAAETAYYKKADMRQNS